MSCTNLYNLQLPAEEIYQITQNLSHIVIYMIKLGFDLFKIPTNLAVDIRAYWSKKNLQLIKVCHLIYHIIYLFYLKIFNNNRKKEQLLPLCFHSLTVQLLLKKMRKTQQ